jgi:endoglucanase Acf2
MKYPHYFALFLACSWGSILAQDPAPAPAPVPVEVGKGSYASFPPAGSSFDRGKNIDRVAEVENRKLYLVRDDGGPIPSTKWYQSLILQQFGTGLWSYPQRVDATKEGLEIFYPTTVSGDGASMVAESPLVITGKDFKPLDSRAKNWTDWTVAFRLFEKNDRFIDVTLGEGMPCTWCEFSGVEPVIAFGGLKGQGSRAEKAPAFFDLTGSAATLPVTGDALGITHEGRSYAVFAPDGTKFEQAQDGVSVTFAGKDSFLVVCPLTAPKDMQTFRKYAFAVPRDSTLAWKYDRQAGLVTTTWKLTTEPLKGTERAVIQGWLPHHWRESKNNFTFNDIKYSTMRGAMKCAAGTEFTISYPFNGILPNLPPPKAGAGYSPERMKAYLAEHFANKKGLAGDTYAGGKDVTRFAQAAFIAAQTNDPSLAAIARTLRNELENWYTYTPGEKNRFFAYYPRRKGLIGFNSSFGSEHFTDNHFHYGYMTFAAGVLSQLQPDFAAQYGDMARLVTKTYANYDRSDRRFPFFRSFDIWRGHSFADGNGFAEGNNQESTSESMNSWAGMILLGQALGDKDLTDAGVMGYTFESRATLEYWFNANGDVFPEAYKHFAAGMIWSSRIVWGTWFTGDPAWIYGIQWIPSGPYLSFYDRDPKLIDKIFANANREYDANQAREASRKPDYKPKPAEVSSHGSELGSYHLGFKMMGDPQWAVAELEKLSSVNGGRFLNNAWMANIYYEAHSLNELGRVDWACHGTSPTSMVYANQAKNTRSMIAWNPQAKAETVIFYEEGKEIGKIEVPPHSMSIISSPIR